MKKNFRNVIIGLFCLVYLFSLVACNGNKKDNRITLVVDGGGANAGFNSTINMIYDPYANPYPYNTLQKLADEWNKTNNTYKIKVASSSINNDRETMVPALNQKTAPDILYYLGSSTISEDMTKGWFVDLNNYFDEPNKYSLQGEDGSVKWKDIYNSEEYATTLAPNGAKYTVEMEMNAIGFIYNKTIFDNAGITKIPTTFKEFMEAQDAIHSYSQTINRANPSDDSTYLTPYFPYYPWFDTCIESAVYSDLLNDYDVLLKDGVVNCEEFVRAYMTKDSAGDRLYSPDSPRNQELYRLIKIMTKYYPTAFESYYAEAQFTAGNLAMMEVQGGTMRKIIDAVGDKFEIGVFSFPILETQPAEEEINEYYTKYNLDNKYTRRGLSGYTTGWGVTCTAVEKGQPAVDACVDFLQYVTCYTNNDKMINDKGFSIPLSGNTTYKYFENLATDYKKDKNNDKSMSWAAITAGGAMNKDYYDTVYLARIEVIKTTNQLEMDKVYAKLISAFQSSANSIYRQNSWNKNDWPVYSGSPIN